jgi:hypothetical protein
VNSWASRICANCGALTAPGSGTCTTCGYQRFPPLSRTPSRPLRLDGTARRSSQVSGFRPGPGWQKAIALTGYGLVAVLVGDGIGSGQPNLAVFGLGGLLLALLAVNAWGLRKRIPLLNSANKVIATSGWVIAVLLLTAGIGLATAATPILTSPAAARNSSPAASRAPAPTPSPIHTSTPTATQTVSPTPSPSPSPTPAQPAGFVTLLNQPTAHRGQNATLSIRTTPNTICSITVNYKSRPATGPGLEDKTSDDAGNVSWTWKVGLRTTLGQWPIAVVCGDSSAQTYVTVS